MAEQEELDFRLNKVGDGPMFEVLLNNVRLDITKVGQLFSVRFSGLITQTQVDKLFRMLQSAYAGPSTLVHGPDTDVGGRLGDSCQHEECLPWEYCKYQTSALAKEEIGPLGPIEQGS